ncbi:MAG: hypothetical protein JEZ11_08060 [Desulfobacterales bacterium]|nr:hypothetical protein [Desulfobacterales bacterium]
MSNIQFSILNVQGRYSLPFWPFKKVPRYFVWGPGGCRKESGSRPVADNATAIPMVMMELLSFVVAAVATLLSSLNMIGNTLSMMRVATVAQPGTAPSSPGSFQKAALLKQPKTSARHYALTYFKSLQLLEIP